MILRGSKIKEDWEEAKPTKILVFLGIATLVHAIFFLLWGQWGSNFYTPLAIPLEAFGVPLEITLELNSLALNEDLEASLSPDTNLAPTPLPNPALPPELVETHSPPTTPPATPPATPPTTPTATLESQNPPASPEKSFPLARHTPLLPEPQSSDTPPRPDNTVKLEETAPTAKSYDITIRTAVAQKWILPPEARTNFRPGRFAASMTLNSQGRIESIVVEESSGSTTLDHAAMEALRAAAPYEPFPPELRHLERMTFRLNFDYRQIVRPARPQG